MNSSINKDKRMQLSISNCGDNTYKLLQFLANIRNESFNQVCCEILFNFKDIPYVFADTKELFHFKSVLTHIMAYLDTLAVVDRKESHILSLANQEKPNKLFLQSKQSLIKDNHIVHSKTQAQYKVIHQLWYTFGIRHASVEKRSSIKKHLLKISKNVPIRIMHPKKPTHAFDIYVPSKLYFIIKPVCQKRQISFHTLFSVALLKQHLIPNIIPTPIMITSIPKQPSAFQRQLIRNYIFYKAIQKSLHELEHKDHILCNQYKKQYKAFIKLIQQLFQN